MDILYQIGIWFYRFTALLISPFSVKAKQFSIGQKKAFPYLEEHIDKTHPIIWVHAASLGEFEQGRPLIEKIKTHHPKYKILLTFFSPSGYEIRKNYENADYICYLPIDSKSNVRKFIELVNPEKAFFIKYEFWKNYFSILKEKEIPLYLISSIFREEQLFFKESLRGRWYQKILFTVSHFFVQTEKSAELLKQIGLNNFTITGDTRFDRVAEIAANHKELPLVDKFKNGHKLIVAGSSWEPDEKLLTTFAKNNPDIKFIIAPHEIKETNIKRLSNLVKEKTISYSEANNQDLSKFQILIIDSIGLLSSIYKYANIAYIGGGFGVGIHNTLEAAIFNIPILFGPNYLKFQEAVNLVEKGIAFPVNKQEELNSVLNNLLNDHSKTENISGKCYNFMNQNIGATQAIIEKVFNN